MRGVRVKHRGDGRKGTVTRAGREGFWKVQWDGASREYYYSVDSLEQVFTFGFELEVRSGARNTLAHLHAIGLTQHTRFHGYHCGCTECAVSLDGPLFKAQQDCTADGEFITRVIEFGSPAADTAFLGIGRALILGGASTDGNVGNHVHVESRGMDGAAKLRLVRLMGRYERDLHEIASAAHPTMRTYNGTGGVTPNAWTTFDPGERFSPYGFWSGSTLAFKNPTVEFRLWNSTRAPWRIRTHVGLSVAMVKAATFGVDCVREDTRCVEDVIGPYIDPLTWAGLLRQRYSKGGFGA